MTADQQNPDYHYPTQTPPMRPPVASTQQQFYPNQGGYDASGRGAMPQAPRYPAETGYQDPAAQWQPPHQPSHQPPHQEQWSEAPAAPADYGHAGYPQGYQEAPTAAYPPGHGSPELRDPHQLDSYFAQPQQTPQHQQPHDGYQPQQYDQHRYEAAGYPPQQAPARDYDLGQYMPATEQQPYAAGAAPDYGQQGDPRHYDPAGAGYQQTGYGQQYPGSAPDGAYDQHGYPAASPYSAAEADVGPEGGQEPFEDELEPKQGNRTLFLVGTLLAAILVGGGLAYGYNKIIGGGKRAASAPPLLQAVRKPDKEPPSDPGGKAFPHSQKSFYERYERPPEGAKAPAAPAEAKPAPGDGKEGPRKVRTVLVRPDGTMAPPPPVAPPARPVAVAPVRPTPPAALPGVVIQGGAPPAPVAVPQPQPARPEQVLRGSVPPAEAPVSVVPKRAPIAAPEPAPAPAPRVTAPVRAPAPPRPAVQREARVAAPRRPVAAPPAAPKGSSARGYVAWVSSQKDRVQALAEFANLQQRYGSAMVGRQPDIQEANLGAKGIWYRLRIGPPGSREAATKLCEKLKSSGLKSCFVRAY
ncbi:MAG: SPOR domain-containing protein [Hyphomicrobiaceae bacterium]